MCRVLSYYEFELDRRVIKYRDDAEEGWKEYPIPEAEKEKARRFFGD